MSARNDLAAAKRVDYRLTYAREDAPRRCHVGGIDGSDLPNAYWGRGNPDSLRTGPGAWEDPDHPAPEAAEREHIDRWFQTAIREAIHEALEWFWVDGEIYLDPHADLEDAVHSLSANFAAELLALRNQER